MFPEFAPEKLMWAMAVAATVAVMMSRVHADVLAHPAHGGATLYAAAASASPNPSTFQGSAP